MARLFRWLEGRAQSFMSENSANRRAGGQGVEAKMHVNPLIALHGFGDASWSGSGYSALASHGYLHNPVVFRCIRMIAEAAASIPLIAFENGRELETHPLLVLVKRPNARQSGIEFLDHIFSSMLVSGNAYLLRLDGNDEPAEIHLLNPGRIRVITGKDGWPQAYEYRAGGNVTRYQATEAGSPLLHLASYSPLSDYEGASPLKAAHHALDIHNASSKWNKALLDNSARPSGALVYTNKEGANLTPDQFERLKSELENGYQGAANSGRPLVLDGGLDWKPMALSPKDMDFAELRNGAARDIALAFGVPPMLLGIPGDNTYANYSEANRVFWRQTVLPLASRFCDAFAHWLSSHWPGELRLDLDRDAVEALSFDREALWKRIGEADFLTRNEKRNAVGYGEIDDNETL